MLLAQHLWWIFCNKDWNMHHTTWRFNRLLWWISTMTESTDHQHLLSFLHVRESWHDFLLLFLVYRDTMSGGRSAVGVVEDTDSAPVMQISWCKVVNTQNRPFGQKTSFCLHHQEGFGITTRGLPRLWRGSYKRPNLTSGDTYRLVSFGHRRSRSGVSWTLLTDEVWEGWRVTTSSGWGFLRSDLWGMGPVSGD